MCVCVHVRACVLACVCVCVCVCVHACVCVAHTHTRSHVRIEELETTILKSIFLLTSCGLVDSSSFCTLLNASHLLKGKRHPNLCNCQMFVVLLTIQLYYQVSI